MARARWYRELLRVSNRLEVASLRYLGTSGLSLLSRTSTLVLETTGRRSGLRRRTPLAYWRADDGALIIGGGAGGLSRVDWVANVRADSEVTVWVHRRPIPMTAHELSGPDYDTARIRTFALMPRSARYEQRSGRRIPLFRLTAS